MKALSLCLALLCLISIPLAKSNAANSNFNSVTNQITSNPQPQSICEGIGTSFKVETTGTVLSYQWQVDVGIGFLDLKSNATFSDVDKAELKINSVNKLNAYKFKCIVAFANGDVIESDEATLNVLTAPVISSHPSSVTACENTSVSFVLGSTGSNITYQWQEDKNDGEGFKNLSGSSLYSGVTSSTLEINAAPQNLNSYKYRCVIKGVCSGTTEVISNAAILTVNPLLVIQDEPADAYTCMSKPLDERTVVFRVNAQGSDLTYQWQVDAGFGFVSPPTTPIHTGINSSELTVSKITSAFDGYIYRCIITSRCGGTKTSAWAVLKVSDNSAAVPGDFTKKTETVVAGSSVEYSVAAVEGAVRYDWTYKNGLGNPVPGVTIYGDGTNSVTVSFSNTATSGTLSVCTANGCGLSAPKSLAVTVDADGTLPVELVSYKAILTKEGTLSLAWSTDSERNNDRFEIEHSSNGSDFKPVGKVLSKGDNQARQTYSFIHKDLKPGINYYKLLQYDKDGFSKVLGIESVDLILSTKKNSVYPNPLVGNVIKIVYDTKDSILPVSVSNLLGQSIFNKNVQVKDGEMEVELSGRPLPGIYLLKVGGNKFVQKIVVN